MSGLQADLRDKARQQELDRRIVPGIPSVLQFLYIAALVLGIAGHTYVSHWWARLWPKEERAEYSSTLGYYAGRTVRVAVLVLMFTPLVGIPAGLWVGLTSLLGQLWFIITMPFRAVRWVWRQIGPVRV